MNLSLKGAKMSIEANNATNGAKIKERHTNETITPKHEWSLDAPNAIHATSHTQYSAALGIIITYNLYVI